MKHNLKHFLMRPITFECMYEVLTALSSPAMLEELSRKCGFMPNRAKEVVRQVEEMGLVKLSERGYVLTSEGRRFVEAAEEGDHSTLHEILMGYRPYREFFNRLLSSGAVRIHDLCRELGISMVAADVLIRLMRKVGVKVIRNERGECYLERDFVEYYKFEETLLDSYSEILHADRVPRSYVSIPDLRRAVKERLRITDEAFDKLLYTFVCRNIGKVVLSPAPSPVKRGKGVKFSKIEYYYIYIPKRG